MGPLKIIALLLLAQTPAQTLPEFSFAAPGGKQLTNANLPPGRLSLFVLVDPDCEHCQRMVSSMDAASAVFNKAAIFMVSASDLDRLSAFARRYCPHIRASWLTDSHDEFISRFHPIRAPALFLYSADKKLLDYEDNPESAFRTANSISKNAR
jgi:hypothetical protein